LLHKKVLYRHHQHCFTFIPTICILVNRSPKRILGTRVIETSLWSCYLRSFLLLHL